DHPRLVRGLLDYFLEHFRGGHSKSVDHRWLEQYRQLWTQRNKAIRVLSKLREKVRRLKLTLPSKRPPPKRIKGHVFPFTGAICNWPREQKLYPSIRKLGGMIATTAKTVLGADCLVHGDILGGKTSTRKLEYVTQSEIPVITEDDFFKILKNEHRLRKKA